MVVAICSALALTALGILRERLLEREPVYAAHPLHYWLSIAEGDASLNWFGISRSEALEKRDLALDALQHMGTNALPCLLDWVKYDGTGWRAKTASLLRTLRQKPFCAWVPRSLAKDRGSYLAYVAPVGLRLLGPAATPAIPELTRMAKSGHEALAANALDCLGFQLGPYALPALIDILSTGSVASKARTRAAYLISLQHTNALPAIPILIGCLGDKDMMVAAAAADALGDLGLRPGTTLPALMSALRDQRPYVRTKAIYAISAFGDEARAAASDLSRLVSDSDPKVREAASAVLGEIAPEWLTNAAAVSPVTR